MDCGTFTTVHIISEFETLFGGVNNLYLASEFEFPHFIPLLL